MKTIILKAKEIGEVKAVLTEDETPYSCEKFWDSLPLNVSLSTWGDELYGRIPVDIEPEKLQIEFEIGDIAYWQEGSGFCILYGPTPASISDKPCLISPGNLLAKIEGDTTIFKGLSSLELTIERDE